MTDAGLVPPRVAETVGVRWGLGDPAAALAESLRDVPTLLVLDNLEQILPSATFIGRLLEQAPAVKVLATSREPLQLRGERQFQLGAMTLIDPADAISVTGEVRPPTRRSGCSSTGGLRSCPALPSIARTRLMSPQSARGSKVIPWRSSWLHPGFGCCRSLTCWDGSAQS